MHAVGVAATAFVMALGVAGTVLPGVPGLGLILVAAAVHAALVGVGASGWAVVAVIGVLAVVGSAAKYVLAGRGVAGSEPSATALVYAVVGAVVGFVALPVVGLPIGGALGVLVAHYRRSRDWTRAWRSTRSVLIGFGLGALIELGTGLVMVTVWLVWVLV